MMNNGKMMLFSGDFPVTELAEAEILVFLNGKAVHEFLDGLDDNLPGIEWELWRDLHDSADAKELSPICFYYDNSRYNRMPGIFASALWARYANSR